MKKALIRLTGLMVTAAIAMSGNGMVLAATVESTGNETGTAAEETTAETTVEGTNEEASAADEKPSEDTKGDEAKGDTTPATEETTAETTEENTEAKPSEEETKTTADSDTKEDKTTVDQVEGEVKENAKKTALAVSHGYSVGSYDYDGILRYDSPDTTTVFHYLRNEIAKIAAGTRTNTKIQVPINILEEAETTYSSSDLGLTKYSTESDYLDALKETYGEFISYEYIVTTLMNACPYELYWYDGSYTSNSTKCEISFNYTYKTDPNNPDGKIFTVSCVEFDFLVSQNYRGSNNYTVNATKAKAANTAAANARAIINKYKNYDDYQKLVGYKNEICSLASFDEDAFYAGSFGDTCQMINVFDGNTATNVYSDGYVRAFQYLCDNTTFNDSSIYAISVFGQSSSGPQSWNIVHMDDGKNYLVDLAACVINKCDDFFMRGVSYKSNGGNEFGYSSYSLYYNHSFDILLRFPSDDLRLSGSDYVYANATVPAQVNATSLALDSLIGVRFKLILPDEFLNDSGAYAEINGVRCEFEEADDKGRYPVMFSVAATELEKSLVIRLYRGDGSLYPLLDKKGNDVTSVGYSYSVTEYISNKLNSSTTSAKLITVLKRLLDYGKNAQLYFNPNTNIGALSDISGDIAKVKASDLANCAATITTAENAGIKKAGTSLALEAATEINHKFELDSGKSINDYKFYVNGTLVTTTSSGNYRLWYNSEKKQYVLTIKGIAPNRLQNAYEVIVKNNSGKEMIKISNYSVMSYGYSIISKSEADASYAQQKARLVTVMKAMYLYNVAAKANFG